MAARSIVRRIQARQIKLAIPSREDNRHHAISDCVIDCATFQNKPVIPKDTGKADSRDRVQRRGRRGKHYDGPSGDA